MQTKALVAEIVIVPFSLIYFIWLAGSEWSWSKRCLTALKYSLAPILINVAVISALLSQKEDQPSVSDGMMGTYPCYLFYTAIASQHFFCRYSKRGGLSRVSALKTTIASLPFWACMAGFIATVISQTTKVGFRDYSLVGPFFLFATILSLLPLGVFYYSRREEHPELEMSSREKLFRACLKMAVVCAFAGGVFMVGAANVKTTANAIASGPRVREDGSVVRAVAKDFESVVFLASLVFGIGLCVVAVRIGIFAFTNTDVNEKSNLEPNREEQSPKIK